MKKILVLSITIALLNSCSSNKTTTSNKNESDDPVVMTINNKPVHQTEFLNIYKKNNPNPKYDKQSLDEYVELFTNYKLKVAEAESLKLDTAKKFKQELAGYKAQLAAPYLIDKELDEKLLKEAYDRRLKEINASHILINSTSEKPEDTLAAYNKIKEIRNDIVNKKISFEDAAVKYSEDPSAKQNKGNLGYFTSLQMVYPFETAAFNTKKGEVSQPVKTKFGYHLIKTHDVRDARGEMRIGHIFVASREKDDAQKKEDSKRKIDEIYGLLEEGNRFEDLAENYSEDKGTASSGGNLGWFSTGKYIAVFEDEAFSLKNNNDYTKPFLSDYGWHIIKRYDYKPIPDFKTMKPELKAKIARDSRAQITKKSFVEKLKKEYNFQDYSSKILPDFYELVDDNIFKGKWKKGKHTSYDQILFEFSNKRVSLGDFAQYLEDNQSSQQEVNIKTYVDGRYEGFVQREIVAFEKTQLSKKYPEYRALMQEYRDGILLFELTDQKVWKKAIQDSVGLEEFYNNNKANYMWEKRVDAEIYKTSTRDIADKTLAMVKQDKNGVDILKEINKTSQLNLGLESGKFEISKKQDVLKHFEIKRGISDVKLVDGSFYIVKIIDIIEPTQKKLDEAKGLIISDYQTYLETNWIKELKAKYDVKVNEDVLYNIKE